MIFKYILDEKGEYKKPEIVKRNEVLSSFSVPAVEIGSYNSISGLNLLVVFL